jgi:hypothetical protein
VAAHVDAGDDGAAAAESRAADTGAEVKPVAVVFATLESPDALADVPAAREEFFGPAFAAVRVPMASRLPAQHAAALAPGTAADGDAGAAAAAASSLAGVFIEAIPALSERVWGNLIAAVVVDGATEAAHATALRGALDALCYGTVLVNGSPFFTYLALAAPWGGYQGPDTSAANPGSGVGMIHNHLLVDGAQKSVQHYDFAAKVMPLMDLLKMPLWLAKGIAALIAGGPAGLWAAITP